LDDTPPRRFSFAVVACRTSGERELRGLEIGPSRMFFGAVIFELKLSVSGITNVVDGE
jgi:hypothetical protein